MWSGRPWRWAVVRGLTLNWVCFEWRAPTTPWRRTLGAVGNKKEVEFGSKQRREKGRASRFELNRSGRMGGATERRCARMTNNSAGFQGALEKKKTYGTFHVIVCLGPKTNKIGNTVLGVHSWGNKTGDHALILPELFTRVIMEYMKKSDFSRYTSIHPIIFYNMIFLSFPNFKFDETITLQQMYVNIITVQSHTYPKMGFQCCSQHCQLTLTAMMKFFHLMKHTLCCVLHKCAAHLKSGLKIAVFGCVI